MKIKFFCIIFLLLPTLVFAQVNVALRQRAMDQALNSMETKIQPQPLWLQPVRPEQPRAPFIKTLFESIDRDRIIEETLRNVSVELAFEYIFAVRGDQTFEVWEDVNGDGNQELESKLWYPHRGEMSVFKGEIGFYKKVFLGGKFGKSRFIRRICTDEDWDFWAMHNGAWTYIEYQRTKQDTVPELDFFDINLYYRLWDLDRKSQTKELSLAERNVLDFFIADKLTFDLLIGYQRQNGRYPMLDPMSAADRIVAGEPWFMVNLPADIGLDSYYKVRYQGPRFGFRTEGSAGKFTARVNFALGLLKTEAFGWWNLRDYRFWQRGKNGIGIDLGTEVTYALTPNFSLGLGLDLLYRRQGKLRESGDQAGVSYEDFNIIRNVDSIAYGPKAVVKLNW